MTGGALALATLAAIVCLTWGLLRWVPQLAHATLATEPAGRHTALDGLRGLLALSVVVHHGLIGVAFARTGTWKVPDGNLENLLGRGSVAVFFMISAYLFWKMVLDREGRVGFRLLMWDRLRRLGPAYFVAVALLVGVAAHQTGYRLEVSLENLLLQVFSWLSFSIAGMPAINGFQNTILALNVTWSLKYEWFLYASLPGFAALYRVYPRSWPICIAFGAGSLLAPWLVFFVAGVAVLLVERRIGGHYLQLAAWPALGCLAVFVALYHEAVGPVQAALLVPVLAAALHPAGPWRCLRWRCLRFLGSVSYSLYLLHSLVIYVVFVVLIGRSGYGVPEGPMANLAVAGVGVIAILAATVSYAFFERPWMRSGPVRPVRFERSGGARVEGVAS